MEILERVKAFASLGKKIQSIPDTEVDEITALARAENGWFTRNSIEKAFDGLTHMLREDHLKKWIENYHFKEDETKIIGIVMAGNIPAVGFHDLLATLISGHFAMIKLSSSDRVVITKIIDWLVEIEPRFKKNIQIAEKLTGVDAVIATGSDNSARYFEHYFREIPHIIRKNRTSIAILTGDESNEELENLGEDIFSFFGLGCRNVSKIFTPKDYDTKSLFQAFERFGDVIHHHKYRNNYDYYKSIFLINQQPHLDTGFLLVTSQKELTSPLSVLYHEQYHSLPELRQVLVPMKEKIQCIVSKEEIPFGQAQKPNVWDYADDVDTLNFMQGLTESF
ncbi:MAG: acyl-CoA reductase [Bacteroidota bacterium]